MKKRALVKGRLFEYTDYRKFLSDYYREQKSIHPYFTVQYIAQKVGFRSPSFFSQICNGRSNLSSEMMFKFSNFLKLTKRQSGFFEALVRYNQAKTQEAKKHYFDHMSTYKEISTRVLNPNEYKFYKNWFCSAILNILSFYRFKGDYKALAKIVEPSITPIQAKQTIQLLEKLGLIKSNPNGEYTLAHPLLSAQSSTLSVILNNYAMKMIDMAKEALNRLPASERSISWVGFSASPETFTQIQSEIRRFRKHILKLAEQDSNPSRVWHFNMQVFPLSKNLPYPKEDGNA